MKIQQRKNINRAVLTTMAILLLIFIAVVSYYFYNKISGTYEQSSTPSNKNGNQTSDQQQAQNLRDNPAAKQTTPNTDTSPSTILNEKTSKQQVQMVASSNISNGNVYIRGGINYAVVGGSCYALLTGPSSQSVRKDTDLLPGPASTDCKTIIIPISELSSGKWTFRLYYGSDNYEGGSDEMSFNI
ncbi:MAG: hypothetical protein WAQ25_03180 [Candidatus Saccharimonas sp.]